jgi:hypothetical protein
MNNDKQAPLTDAQKQAVYDAVTEALGDAYDCLRAWSAWGYGTMSEDDFRLVAEDGDRVAEIADAAIAALSRTAPLTDAEKRFQQLCEEAPGILANGKKGLIFDETALCELSDMLSRAAPPDYAAMECETLGDPEKRTGVYASPAQPTAQACTHGTFGSCPECDPERYPFPERDASKPSEAQGMFLKFDVRRIDGSDGPGGKHYGCRYFVLDMDHDAHAPAALRAYADSCAGTHPQLAAELRNEFGPKVAQASAEPVVWANWKVGSKSYVPYRTREEAAACVKNSSISATQDGPYAVVGLVPAPVASAAPKEPIDNPNELEPPELLASRLINAWCAHHGKQIPWAKAIEITAIVTKMPAEEKAALLALDDAAIAAAPKEPTT